MHRTPTSSVALARARSNAGQGGYTLIEVVIASLLAGMVILSLAAAVLTIIRTNAQTAEREQVDAGLASFAESLRAADYLPCDDLTTPGTDLNYQAQYDLWPERWNPRTGMDATVIGVEYWNGTEYVPACAGERGAQRLTLQVNWRETERQTHVVKRQR